MDVQYNHIFPIDERDKDVEMDVDALWARVVERGEEITSLCGFTFVPFVDDVVREKCPVCKQHLMNAPHRVGKLENTFQVQTRSDEGGLRYFGSLQEAFDYAEKNKDVWKISFNAEDGSRCRFVKTRALAVVDTEVQCTWVFEPLDVTNPDYRDRLFYGPKTTK